MKKIISIALGMALFAPLPVSAEVDYNTQSVPLSNLYATSNGHTQVYAGVSLPSRELVVNSSSNKGNWSATFSVRASHQFPISISISDAGVLVSGRKHSGGGFAATIRDGELVWSKDLYEVRSGAIYESGASVVAGYDATTQNAKATFISASGATVWESEFPRDYPTAFESVDLVDDLVYLRGRSRCGESSACDAESASAIIVVLDQHGNQVAGSDILLTDIFGISTGFRSVYPWLTVSGSAPHPDGGWVFSGLGMKSDTGQECLLLARVLGDLSVQSFSDPLFCEQGQDLYENRGAVFVTQSGDAVVALSSYYELDIAGPSSGATDFLVAVVSDVGVEYQSQFGTEFTDHPNSVHLMDQFIVMSGNNSSGVIARLPFSGDGYYSHSSISPNWEEPEVLSSRIVPSAPQSLSLTRSASHIRASWLEPENDGGSRIERYIAVAHDASGNEIGSCIGRTYDMSCSIQYSSDGEYSVSVIAVNRRGDGDAVSGSISVFYALPGAPENTSHSTMRGRVSVSYSAPSFTGGLRVNRYKIDLIKDGKVIASRLNAANRRSVAFTGLQPGEYQYVVYARNARGWGDASSITSVMVP